MSLWGRGRIFVSDRGVPVVHWNLGWPRLLVAVGSGWRRVVRPVSGDGPMVIPAVVANIDKVVVPFEPAGSPTPCSVPCSKPYSRMVAQSWVSMCMDVIDNMRVVDGYVNVLGLNGLDDNRLFPDDLDLFVALQVTVIVGGFSHALHGIHDAFFLARNGIA